MEKKSIHEVLKQREMDAAATTTANGQPALDDTRRVKVLSPGRLVFKRFIRNKLAIVGSAILIFMFVFCFIGAMLYPYGQTQKFYKHDELNIQYAIASERNTFSALTVNKEIKVHYSVANRMSTYITEMIEQNISTRTVTDDEGVHYLITQLAPNVFRLDLTDLHPVATVTDKLPIGTFNRILKNMMFADGAADPGEGFINAVSNAEAAVGTVFSFKGNRYEITAVNKRELSISLLTGGAVQYTEGSLGTAFEKALKNNLQKEQFSFEGEEYRLTKNEDGTVTVSVNNGMQTSALYTKYVFDFMDTDHILGDDFRIAALTGLADGSFRADGKDYVVSEKDGFPLLSEKDGKEVARLSTFAVRRNSGEDTLSVEFKDSAYKAVQAMLAEGKTSGNFVFSLPHMDKDGNYSTDENGELAYEDTPITVTNKNGQYVMTCLQNTYLIDIYGSPSAAHIFGTDSDGFDVLARMMYGGRISLLVGFVVVLLETLLGVIMGGIAGYFGGWVDTLIMRLVDIFNCIPSMPILIIMGAFFDSLKMNSYLRLVWMMVILGILGWSGIARLVRGQILSLREQEFMVATEACGLNVRRRIFRHLIPNVMPQLIVTATAGLGSVIIMESTLSFLGLGVKHPLATWGTMINSVTASSESMIKYTYIWIPVGLLICLTVIAFNFVGDGLRDAFDPKMKR